MLSSTRLTAARADLADVDVTTLDSALERARHEMAVKVDKMKRHLLPAMRRNDVDLWIILSREFNVDPLLDLFGGRRQLIVYRAFFEPGVHGWPEHACPGCSMVADQVAHVAHLNARDTTLAFVSRAPQADVERLKTRMGWTMPWLTITDSFDADFGVGEWHGTNAFIRDGENVFRTYFVNNRGDEQMGSTWNYLDITALGRQEEWEDSPEGYPQTPPYKWWNWHDEYGDAQFSQVGSDGVYHSGTRFLSLERLLVGGARPLLLSSTITDDNTLLAIDMANAELRQGEQIVMAADTLHIFRSKFLYQGTCFQRLRIKNHGRRTADFEVSFEFAADFADIFEIRGEKRPRRGRCREIERSAREMSFTYDGLDDIARTARLRWNTDAIPFNGTLLRFPVALEPEEEPGPGEVEQQLGHRGDDGRAAGRPERQERLPVLEHDRG